MKKCIRCQLEKPITDFGKVYYEPDLKSRVCKTCINLRAKTLRAARAAKQVTPVPVAVEQV